MFLNKSVVSSLSMALLLSACSGSDGFGVGNGNPDDSSGTETTETDSGTDTSPTADVDERLGSGSGNSFDAGAMVTGLADGEVLSYGASTTISVNVVNAGRDNELLATPTSVSFSSACATQGLATIGESALSSAGVATVNYTATSCTGSDTITATTTDDEGNTSTASVTIDISSLGLGRSSGDSFVSGEMTTLTDGVDLTYGGDTVVSVNIVDTNGNTLFTSSSVSVSFTSNCVQQGKSDISSSVNTTTGTAVATYTANTCEGPDVITATLSDGTSATANINVAEQILGELAFVSADPSTIALKGSGSSAHPEVTTVTFSLNDATGEPMAGETIEYSLSTNVGGITFPNGLSTYSSVTDEEGNTSVQLTAGGVNISVAIIATVTVEYEDGSTATTTTTSDSIAVLGGLPDQDSFTLSVETFNPRGWDISGTTSRMTVRAGDRFNNEARDGTQVSFVTTGGQIVGSCELDSGFCSVDWTSSNPRPDNGLVHIMARTTGEESFIDANLNGQYDLGEVIDVELDEAYIDVNYNGVRDDNEFYSDFNNNQVYDTKTNPGFYQGASCTEAAEEPSDPDDPNSPYHCESLVDVRRVATICMSEDDVVISDNLGGGVLDASAGAAGVLVTITDGKGLMPANGTTVAVSVEDGEIVTGQNIVIPNQCPVDSDGNPIPFTNMIIVEADDDPATSFGTLKVAVTRADGVIEERFISFLH